jgi:hypothetical protein
VRPQPGGFNHLVDVATEVGVMPLAERAPWLCPAGSSGPLALGQAADLPVTQGVIDQDEKFAGQRGSGHVLGRRSARRWKSCLNLGPRPLLTASMAAHRTSFEPCLVSRPRRTLVSDSRCLGVKPAHEHSA